MIRVRFLNADGSLAAETEAAPGARLLDLAQALGLPLEPLGLLLAVDTIPDAFATVGNVTADLGATSVVDKRTSAID